MTDFKWACFVLPVLVTACTSNNKNSVSPEADRIELARQSQPNFVIILADDLGYQDVGCFGSQLISTPYLDKMAEEGMKFTSFYAQTI